MEFNIVYFAFVGQNFGGVEQKIISQFDALLKLTPKTDLYLVSSLPSNDVFASEIDKRSNVKVLINTPGRINNPWKRRKEKFQLISKALEAYDPEITIVYLRYPMADFLLLNFLKFNKRYKIITEHQQIENTSSGLKFNGNYLNNILETIFGRSVRKRIHAFVGVTSEITDYQINKSGDLNKMSATIGNGINVEKYPVRTLNHSEPEIIKILFVGSGFGTHGLDRVIKGMADYVASGENKRIIYLRIAGDSHEMHRNRELVKKIKISKFVEFLGNQNNAQLNEHFNWADVCVGSLGLHRIGLNYSSTLKAREYASRGIPFFWSTLDEDFGDDFKYIYHVESDDSDVNLNDITSFALNVRSDFEHPRNMKCFALNNLTWDIKMKKLFQFFESAIKKNEATNLYT